MKLIHTDDGECYRRWINIVFSLLLPGSAQFLSGRKILGVTLFGVSLVWVLLVFGYLIYSGSPYSVTSMGPFNWADVPLAIAIAADAFRRPIRRLKIKGWCLFFCVWLGILLLPALAIHTFLIQPFMMPSASMQPTIMGNRKDAHGNPISGGAIFVDKWIYRFAQPRRGDVVVFKTEGIKSLKLDSCFVKRIAGLPGETVSIDPPYLVVNGNKITTPDIFRKIEAGENGFSGFCLVSQNTSMPTFLKSSTDKITLGPDEYLVLGDNTPHSLDGRYFGPIKRDVILGKAFYIYAPADRKRTIE
jgi:signal peptidase I